MKPVAPKKNRFAYIISILMIFSATCSYANNIDALLSVPNTNSGLLGNQLSPYQRTLQRYFSSSSNTSTTTSQNSTTTAITPKVVGGYNTSASNYPWMAALLISSVPNGREAQFCGGTLVASDLVVTAAHCLAGIESSDQIQVALGVSELRNLKADQRIPVAAFVYHSAYDPNLVDNDIGLIRLAKSVTNPPLPFITPDLMLNVTAGKSMRLLGYGYLNDVDYQLPNVLQSVTLPYVDHGVCAANFAQISAIIGQTITLTDHQICAGTGSGSTDACFGDSGGPLITTINGQSYLTGIVSWGLGCATQGTYGVYTEVADYAAASTGFINAGLDLLYVDSDIFVGMYGDSEGLQQRSVTFYNFTNASANLGSISLQSGGNGYSIPANSCANSTLAAHSSCSISVDFDPAVATAGRQTDVVLFSSTATTNTSQINLTAYSLSSINAGPALDISGLTWFSGGTNGSEIWSAASSSAAEHGSALKNASISSNQRSFVTTTINGPGILSFDWKFSSASGSIAAAIVDNSFYGKIISGQSAWRQEYVSLSPGPHRIIWAFAPDNDFGNDYVMLDNLYFSKNAWLLDKAANSPKYNPLGEGASQIWILLLILFVWHLWRHRRQVNADKT